MRSQKARTKPGTVLLFSGFEFRVLGPGKCDEPGCQLTAVRVLDPEGHEDTVHVEECDACDA